MGLMLVYKSMGKDIQKIYRFDWQISGVLAGYIVIALTIGQTLLFISQRSESDFYYYGTILFIGKFGAGLISMKFNRKKLIENRWQLEYVFNSTRTDESIYFSQLP